jgi:MFS family permease
MNSIEKKSAIAIAFMIALRMYGLFLILPVFAIYGKNIAGSTPFLIGIAIGIYGLTQAILQIPMGLLSDIWGRKKVIALGLVLFLSGSVVAAVGTQIETIILGRLIQGMGAIAATGLALVADVSRPEQRGKLMAIIGSSIGFSFMLAFITGPIIASYYGLSGLFWFTAFLAFLALMVLIFVVKEPEKRKFRDYKFKELVHCVKQKELVFMDFGVFALHAGMTGLFLLLPNLLVNQFDLPLSNHWKVYLPVMLLSLLIMVPMLRWQEKLNKQVQFLLLGFTVLGLNFFLLSLPITQFYMVLISLVIYFGFFNFLEASMPSMLSKIALEKYRGAAMGVYSTAQFLGAFVGGAIAGWLMSQSNSWVYYALAAMMLLLALVGRAMLYRKN